LEFKYLANPNGLNHFRIISRFTTCGLQNRKRGVGLIATKKIENFGMTYLKVGQVQCRFRLVSSSYNITRGRGEPRRRGRTTRNKSKAKTKCKL
jgi:hypothetical protein